MDPCSDSEMRSGACNLGIIALAFLFLYAHPPESVHQKSPHVRRVHTSVQRTDGAVRIIITLSMGRRAACHPITIAITIAYSVIIIRQVQLRALGVPKIGGSEGCVRRVHFP